MIIWSAWRPWESRFRRRHQPSAEIIETGDIDIPALRRPSRSSTSIFRQDMAVAVQDHGYSPEKSNRLVRFEHLAEAIRSGGSLEAFAYRRASSSHDQDAGRQGCTWQRGIKAASHGHRPGSHLWCSSGSALHRARAYHQLRKRPYSGGPAG